MFFCGAVMKKLIFWEIIEQFEECFGAHENEVTQKHPTFGKIMNAF
jgi:hypothetical protein